MKTSNEKPPMFEEIYAKFPDCEARKAIFCYGDTIYNPFGGKITPDLEVHESVHSKQQGSDPEKWWRNYLDYSDFRAEQELAAYGTQLFFVKQSDIPKKIYGKYEDNIAFVLSGALYGNVYTLGEAKSKLRNFVKNLEKEKKNHA